jgi:hypothetical protein
MQQSVKRIFRSSVVIVDAGRRHRELTQIGLAHDVHISFPGDFQARCVTRGRRAVLGDVFRSGSGHHSFYVNEIFHRQAQSVAIPRRTPIGDERMIASSTRRTPQRKRAAAGKTNQQKTRKNPLTERAAMIAHTYYLYLTRREGLDKKSLLGRANDLIDGRGGSCLLQRAEPAG